MKRKSFKSDLLRDEIAKREKQVKPKNRNKDVEVAKKKNRHKIKHQLATEDFERQERFQQRIIEKIQTDRRNGRKKLHHLKRQPDVYAEAG